MDAGYPNTKGYLAPYKGDGNRYHLPQFRNGERPWNAREKFNFAHSSLRSVIERTFGVWKDKWKILNNMPFFKYEDQVCIVSASMAIHSFIRRSKKSDIEFDIYDNNSFLVPEGEPEIPGETHHKPQNDETEMEIVRDQICAQIVIYN